MEVITSMKKFMSVICSTAITLTLVVPAASAAPTAPVQEFSSLEKNVSVNQTKNLIDIVEPYVEVNKDGLLQFKDVPQAIYDSYNLSELQKHFDTLNTMVTNGRIIINSDLNIIDQSMSARATYGSWDYHWWGYDRNFGNSETLEFIDYCNSVAGGQE